MSIRTIVEFNNDYIEDLRRNGHISDLLFRCLTGCDSERIQGLHIVTRVHHSTDYSVIANGMRIPRYDTANGYDGGP